MSKKILVIEDGQLLMDMKCDILEGAGYETVRAVDGIEGVQKAYDEKPDLILSDIRLPDVDGYQICRLLKNDKLYKKIPIIMTTASKVEKKDEFWGLQVGADAYITEPFEPENLLELIKKFIDIIEEDKEGNQ